MCAALVKCCVLNNVLLLSYAQLLHQERWSWDPVKISFQGSVLFQVMVILLSMQSHFE